MLWNVLVYVSYRPPAKSSVMGPIDAYGHLHSQAIPPPTPSCPMNNSNQYQPVERRMFRNPWIPGSIAY